MLTKQEIYDAAKAYYAKGGAWGKGHYNSGGQCCFIGAAAKELNLTNYSLERELYNRFMSPSDIIVINDRSQNKESALNAIARLLEVKK